MIGKRGVSQSISSLIAAGAVRVLLSSFHREDLKDGRLSWNHRVVRDENGILFFAEVFYNEAGKPDSYTDPFMCGDNAMELKTLLARLSAAMEQPVLDMGDIGNERP